MGYPHLGNGGEKTLRYLLIYQLVQVGVLIQLVAGRWLLVTSCWLGLRHTLRVLHTKPDTSNQQLETSNQPPETQKFVYMKHLSYF